MRKMGLGSTMLDVVCSTWWMLGVHAVLVLALTATILLAMTLLTRGASLFLPPFDLVDQAKV